MVETMMAEQLKQTADMEALNQKIDGIAELLPMLFGMVKVATYSDELKDRMVLAADIGRKIIAKQAATPKQ